MKLFLFQVHGSIASWGTSAGDQQRPTDRVPTKSAVLGLLAASLGIGRDEDESHQRLANDLNFGVAVESYGQQFRDYHTALPPESDEKFHATRRDESKWGEGNAVISYRSYRVDGLYTIILSLNGDAKTNVTDLKEALKHPYYTPYLGRKSCPMSLPFDPMIVEESHPLDGVVRFWGERSLPLDDGNRALNRAPQEFDFYWGGILPKHDSFELLNRRSRHRRDQPVSRDRWIFDSREEEQVRVRRD